MCSGILRFTHEVNCNCTSPGHIFFKLQSDLIAFNRSYRDEILKLATSHTQVKDTTKRRRLWLICENNLYLPILFGYGWYISRIAESQRALYVQCTYIVRTLCLLYVQCTYIVRTVTAGVGLHLFLFCVYKAIWCVSVLVDIA